MKSSLIWVLIIYGIIVMCSGNEIGKWKENPLIKQTMNNGSIVGSYKDMIYGLSPWNKHYSYSNGNGTIKMNVTSGKVTTFSYPESSGHDKFDGFGAPNSFATIGDDIYFIANDDESCSGQVLCESGDTHLSSFSMATETFTDEYIKIGHYDSESLPCLTSFTFTNKGKENHYLIIMGGSGNGYECDSDSHDDDDKSSNAVMLYHVETHNTMCIKKMNAPSHNFGCKVASDGYLYKFGGNTCHSSSSSEEDNKDYQVWRFDLNTFDGYSNSIKNNNWEPVKIDLPVVENPTILELKQDKLLYIIGGYDQEQRECTKDVYCLDVNNSQYPYQCNDKPQSLVEPHCFEAGIEVNEQFYLFDGTELQFTANINTSSPTVSPTEKPTDSPTNKPSDAPTDKPSSSPTDKPSQSPSNKPSNAPTDKPSDSPTNKPSESPTDKPSDSPTDKPTLNPSNKPSNSPSDSPTDKPSTSPTDKPSSSPTNKPSTAPSDAPSNKPSASPSNSPSDNPSSSPSNKPSGSPSNSPSNTPSSSPTVEPTGEPTTSPTITAPKSTQESSSTNWIIIGCSIGAAALIISLGVYCIVKRYKARMNAQPLL